jgi:cell division protein ZapA
MSAKSTLTIQVLGKDYKVACPPGGEAALQDAATLLNDRLTAANKGRISGERLMVMVALNLAHDLRAAASGKRQAALQENTGSLDSDELARRIAAIETRIDTTLTG